MGYEPKIFFSIDDYGMTPLTCERIEQCVVNGAANKISVLPNTRMEDMPERLRSLHHASVCIHINLVEGKCVSDPNGLNLLVDADGFFNKSFFCLLMTSLGAKRREFRGQLHTEIQAQLQHAISILPENAPILLDSHQHTHMIPLIFDVLMQVVRELSLDAKYIRIPAEPELPYLLVPAFYPQYLSVNLIKHWVLKFCGLFNAGKLSKSGIPTALFCGILFSGNMNYDRVSRVLPGYIRLAKKKQCDVEFLFHSGYTNQSEPLFDDRKVEFHHFYYSQGRKNEYDALMKLKENH